MTRWGRWFHRWGWRPKENPNESQMTRWGSLWPALKERGSPQHVISTCWGCRCRFLGVKTEGKPPTSHYNTLGVETKGKPPTSRNDSLGLLQYFTLHHTISRILLDSSGVQMSQIVTWWVRWTLPDSAGVNVDCCPERGVQWSPPDYAVLDSILESSSVPSFHHHRKGHSQTFQQTMQQWHLLQMLRCICPQIPASMHGMEWPKGNKSCTKTPWKPWRDSCQCIPMWGYCHLWLSHPCCPSC